MLAFGAIYFAFLSNTWIYYGLLSPLFAILGVIGSFLMPESPKYLIRKKKYIEANEVFSLSSIQHTGFINFLSSH